MMSDVAIRSMLKSPEDLGVLIRRQQEEAVERERELARLRSGSAPPTVEGSLTAAVAAAGLGCGRGGRGFGSEEELRADPAYAKYYYSSANLNPRLPPPLVSKEDWRFAQQLNGGGGRRGGGGGGGGDGGEGDRSLFSVQPGGFEGKEEGVIKQRKGAAEWAGCDGLIGLPALGLGSRQRSIAELFQVRS